MAPLPPLRDGGCALPICPFGRACHPLISDAPDCKCSPGRLRFWVVWASCPGAAAPISIHAPRVGRDARLSSTPCASRISIHAPRVGRDLPMPSLSNSAVKFQSTRPVWGATAGDSDRNLTIKISIHAPRVGRDQDFGVHFLDVPPFQSTRPVWGATGRYGQDRPTRCNFNPRAPCGARPAARHPNARCPSYFNPRAPCGARRASGAPPARSWK